MPTINNPIVFSMEALQKIAEVQREPGYDHTRWGGADLESVRCEIRNFYRREQRLSCAYCREQIGVQSAASAPVEHIVPKSRYLQFMFEPQNLCVICADCNEFKRSREAFADPPLTGNAIRTYPTDTNRYRLFHPHFDEYQDHIIKVGFLYLEKSGKGAYTIYICKLNRFVQNFGVSEEFMDSLQTITERERFHEG